MGRVVSATEISSVPPGTVARLPPYRRGSRPGFRQRSRSLRRRGPLATAREPDVVAGARKGHGPVRLTGRRAERRLARVAPAGEGRTGGRPVRAALSAGPDNDRDVAQRCRITHRPQGAIRTSDRPLCGRDRDTMTADVAGRSPSGRAPPDRASPMRRVIIRRADCSRLSPVRPSMLWHEGGRRIVSGAGADRHDSWLAPSGTALDRRRTQQERRSDVPYRPRPDRPRRRT